MKRATTTIFTLLFLLTLSYNTLCYDSLDCYFDALSVDDVKQVIGINSSYYRERSELEQVSSIDAVELCIGATSRAPVECLRDLDSYLILEELVIRVCHGGSAETAECYNSRLLSYRVQNIPIRIGDINKWINECAAIPLEEFLEIVDAPVHELSHLGIPPREKRNYSQPMFNKYQQRPKNHDELK